MQLQNGERGCRSLPRADEANLELSALALEVNVHRERENALPAGVRKAANIASTLERMPTASAVVASQRSAFARPAAFRCSRKARSALNLLATPSAFTFSSSPIMWMRMFL